MLCRLLKAAGVSDVPSLTTRHCTEFVATQDSWWDRFTECTNFCKRSPQTRRRFHHEVQTDGVSVSVLMFQPDLPSTSPAPPPVVKGKKRKRQQQDTTEWVRGLSDRSISQAHRIVGLDPGRKALFTTAVHSQQAADSLHRGRPCETKYDTLSWSCSKLQEASGIKYRLHKTEMWFSQRSTLRAALLDTPSAKVASTAKFLEHIYHRLQHAAAARQHFGDRRHRQLRWRTFIKRQQAYTAICQSISASDSSTVVAYGDANFSSSCCKGNPSTPTVSLRRALGRCCKVYDTDEFRTSKLCCACKTVMGGMPLPPTGNPLPHVFTGILPTV